MDKGIAHHICAPLFTGVEPGLSSNCRQLPEKAILRTQRDVVLQFRQKLRADERARTAYPCSLRVCGQALLGIAWVCKLCISKRFVVPRIAHYCRVLRPG